MADNIIRDTSKLTLKYTDKKYVVYIPSVTGFRYDNGKKPVFHVLCSPTKLANETVFDVFFQRLVDEDYITRNETGFYKLTQQNGNYVMVKISEEEALKKEMKKHGKGKSNGKLEKEICNQIEKRAYEKALADFKATQPAPQAQTEEQTNTPIVDPNSESAKALLNKQVMGSMAYSFDAKVTVEGELTEIRPTEARPFVVKKKDGTLYLCPFIRKPSKKLMPFALADSDVRLSLRGKWVIRKDKCAEFQISRFDNQGGWRCNGVSASCLLKDYAFEDGSPCGELVDA